MPIGRFLAFPTLTSPAGRPTNAIYGFIRMLGKARDRARPSRTAVVWDGGLAADRMALLPEYKAQRAEMPAGWRPQLDRHGRSTCGRRGFVLWRKEGCEADDCIAALAVQAAAAGLPVVIASSDKDFMQLVSEGVKLLVPHDKTESLWDAAQVRAEDRRGPGANCGLVEPGRGLVGQHPRRSWDWPEDCCRFIETIWFG